MTHDTLAADRLWIIESPRQGAETTGQRLYETMRESGRDAAYEAPVFASEMLGLLRDIGQTAGEGFSPILHFECGGSPEGLHVANGECIRWDDLRTALVAINEACGVNLVVVLAACTGAYLIKAATCLGRAPFVALIAPGTEETPSSDRADFGAFYAALFALADVGRAVATLNTGEQDSTRRYQLLSAERLFLLAFTKDSPRILSNEGQKATANQILTRMMQFPSLSKRTKTALRSRIAAGIIEEEQLFEAEKRRFFFLDRFPDMAGRFGVAYADFLRPSGIKTTQHPM